MRRDPVRIEPYLTRDYVERADKIRDFDESRPIELGVTIVDIIATFIVLAGLVVLVALVW
ncbi:hypothetical protein [Nitrospira sp. BLG_1]|uniref:hypothetical protein n=1 Tax=Nitrospira sp. BLG_1 TaxID=3395883 RepID=UPI0039BD5FAA